MASDQRLGTEIAGYRIESLLGRGGMSTVYVAEDLRLKRQVALKILAPELAENEGFRDRFVRESQLAAGMEHPNIVPIYEAGEADGHLFIAMRWIRGTDLRKLIERDGVLEPRRAARIVTDVAGALDAAHQAGLVHRDVKPANILVIEGGGSEGRDLVYLSDFGLTKRLGSEGAGLTKTGQFVGTVDYVAPEQIEGKTVDGRADVYSLACVLFECLSGKVPYGREAEVAALYAHLQEKPPKLTAFRPDMPQALDRVFARALSKSPVHRHPTAGEFASAARDAIGASSGERPSISAATITAVTRRPLALVGVAILAALVAGGIVFAATRGGGSSAAANGSPSVTPSTIGTQVPNFEKLDRPPTQDELRLLSYVPTAIEPGCGPSATRVGQSMASVACTSGRQQVLYELYATRDSMDAAFDQNLSVLNAPPGDCSTDHNAFATYTVGDDEAGRVLCYLIRGRSQIEWTDERLFVYTIAIRPDPGDLSLYGWWVKQAGPVDTSSATPTLEKDATSPIATPPVGTWLTSITQADTKSPKLKFNTTKLEGKTTAWAGTWGLELDGGTYTLTHLGNEVETGSYSLSKGDEVVFVRASGTCEDAGSAVYGLSTVPGGVTWAPPPSAGACIAGPWPVTLHAWVRPPTGEIAAGAGGGDGPIVTQDIGGHQTVVAQTGVQPTWSPDGSRIAFAAPVADGFQLFVVNADGSNVRQLTHTKGSALDPAWSPDGSEIAFHTDQGGNTSSTSTLSVIHPDGTGERVLLSRAGNVGRPAWSPDGSRIAFRIDDAIYVMNADGSRVTELTRVQRVSDNPMAWMPDGEHIIYWGDAPGTSLTGLCSMSPDGKDIQLLAPAPPGIGVLTPDVSPDGRWILLGGQWDIRAPMYVFDVRTGQLLQLSQDNVDEPRWRPGAP
jgi:serine/threonine-protein kinase